MWVVEGIAEADPRFSQILINPSVHFREVVSEGAA
jgi:hypothetical protein